MHKLLLVPALWTATALASTGAFHATQRDRGTVVELSIADPSGATTALRERQPAQFTLGLRDETTGRPISGVYANVWMLPYRSAGADEPKRCTAAVAALLSGGLSSPAAVDLNVYYVVTLNGDGTINVVDPHFSFGGTQLLAMIQLQKPGWDWALSARGDRLFVTVPELNRVAVIDTVRWKVERYVDAGPNPRRIVAAPDGHVWVTNAYGVAAIRTSDAVVDATIATGSGEHDLVVTDDGRYVIVAQERAASVIDARGRELAGTTSFARSILELGGDHGPAGPASVAYSALSGMAYVASANGKVTVFDPKRRMQVAQFDAQPGLTQIRIAPGGRFAFIPNPEQDVVEIVDTAANRIIQRATISDAPFDVSFTNTIAYVRRLGSESVQMIPLAGIGKEGDAVPVVDFPAGEYPFGKAPRATGAAGIVPAPDENGVLVANPADQHIYYYKEGMAAPIGHFSNYGHYAQAVLVLDRSIRETRDGYTTMATLPAAGEYDVAVFVGAPRTVSCFRVSVAADPAVAAKRLGMPVNVEPLTTQRVVTANSASKLAFRLTDPATQQPRSGVADAMLLIVRAGSNWLTRQALAPRDGGRYEAEFTPPAPGIYYVYVGASSIGLKTSNPQFFTIEAR